MSEIALLRHNLTVSFYTSNISVSIPKHSHSVLFRKLFHLIFFFFAFRAFSFSFRSSFFIFCMPAANLLENYFISALYSLFSSQNFYFLFEIFIYNRRDIGLCYIFPLFIFDLHSDFYFSAFILRVFHYIFSVFFIFHIIKNSFSLLKFPKRKT